MKIALWILLLAACDCCFGQTDTNLIAAGDWSDAVMDSKSWASLRGRLLVYRDEVSTNDQARVYLELQHVKSTNGWNLPVAVYYDPDRTHGNLRCEMSDETGQSIRPVGGLHVYTLKPPCWVTLPYDATLRLRADFERQLTPKPSGLQIEVGGDMWVIPPNPTNSFLLSGTFGPQPVDHPNMPRRQVWQGTLTLPKVKITVN